LHFPFFGFLLVRFLFALISLGFGLRFLFLLLFFITSTRTEIFYGTVGSFKQGAYQLCPRSRTA